ncbi:hypothetical protein NMY22_g4852 [Coprinellus aureogranulatus]|nr:hypothetical protein NMY22_g4852 [Coprinellus aureogranulatus]
MEPVPDDLFVPSRMDAVSLSFFYDAVPFGDSRTLASYSAVSRFLFAVPDSVGTIALPSLPGKVSAESRLRLAPLPYSSRYGIRLCGHNGTCRHYTGRQNS